jgi:hypothetical protein
MIGTAARLNCSADCAARLAPARKLKGLGSAGVAEDMRPIVMAHEGRQSPQTDICSDRLSNAFYEPMNPYSDYL